MSQGLNHIAKYLAVGLLTVGLCYWVARSLDLAAFQGQLNEIDWLWVCAAFVGFMVIQGLRAVRLKLVALPTESWRHLVPTMCLQSAANKVLPLWLGEAALVVLLRYFHGVRLHAGTAALLLVRGLDLLVLALVILAALLAYSLPSAGYAVGAAAILFGLGVASLLLMLFARHGTRWFTKSDAANRSGMLALATRNITILLEHLVGYSRPRELVLASGLTVALWIIMIALYACLLRALNIELAIPEMLGLYAILSAVRLLPVKGFGEFGTHEAAWFLGLQAVGITPEVAAIAAFSSHILFYAITMAAGFIGLSGFLIRNPGPPKNGRTTTRSCPPSQTRISR